MEGRGRRKGESMKGGKEGNGEACKRRKKGRIKVTGEKSVMEVERKSERWRLAVD